MKQSSPSRPVVMNCLRKVFRGLLGLSPSSINAFSTVIYSEGVQHFLYWASSISPRPVFFLSFSFLSVSSVLSFFCSEAERNVNSHYLSGWVSYNLFLKWSLMVEYEVERSQTPWSFRYFISGKRQVEMTVFPTHPLTIQRENTLKINFEILILFSMKKTPMAPSSTNIIYKQKKLQNPFLPEIIGSCCFQWLSFWFSLSI